MSGSQRLRSLLKREATLLAPGAINPMFARLVEQAGFDAVYMTGGGTSLAFGHPDVGLLTMTEMVDAAARIVEAVNIPVISDADTGYGNAVNVWRTVREFERAGVAAIHLEDQEFPKKCGHLGGKALIDPEEMAMKVRAACAARRDGDMVIIARVDAILVNGLEDAIARANRYRDAGADMIFVESPRNIDDVKQIVERVDAPLLYNMASSGKSPFLSGEELSSLGYDLMIMPNFTTLAAIKAAREVLAEMFEAGSAAPVLDRCATFADFMSLAGLEQVQEIEERFGTDESRRTAI